MAGRPTNNSEGQAYAAPPVYPFTAIVGQEEMKLALLLNAVAPSVGGVLITGHRGTGKSTAVRALADLLPPLTAVRGCPYNCDPAGDARELCAGCRARLDEEDKLPRARRAVPVVELPLGATEDRVCGTIDLGRAVREGVKAFEPGLLARANRGFLYVDEVNLLEDHLVDVLLDVAATGRNRVEREGVSAEHPARFVLAGSSNPEEGELRPQLLDRFGLCVEVETLRDVDGRVEIVERREAFERDPARFAGAAGEAQDAMRRRLVRAQRNHASVEVPRPLLRSIAELCLRLGVDGHRGELTITRAARALAAFEGRRRATQEDVRRVAGMALRHRLRRDPLEQSGGGARVEKGLDEVLGKSPRGDSQDPEDGGGRGRASDPPPSAESQGEKVVPPVSLVLGEDVSGVEDGRGGLRRTASAARRRAGGRRSSYTRRGRYSGSDASARGPLAVDATLRAAAPRRDGIEADDLRFKRFRGRVGALYIFAVDASGSMAAGRIGQAKGALAHLLRRSYLNRDRVALVTFRASGAELLLAPSGSPSRARALIEALPAGGATPLAAGLLLVLRVARRAKVEGARSVRLVIFTDGRANVPLGGRGDEERAALGRRINEEIARLGSSLRDEGVASLVVDARGVFTGGREGEFLSRALGGRYVRLPRVITEESVSGAFDG
ncbi:MAG TPA: magnesium chelatase ATPase subunit I [Pyrinomonadaceae bacterium]|jgi:magnesium chelatase subunit D|nr:magnesium chelatase ATPase subunit I [Pyrinomonadaceae bacterium]